MFDQLQRSQAEVRCHRRSPGLAFTDKSLSTTNGGSTSVIYDPVSDNINKKSDET